VRLVADNLQLRRVGHRVRLTCAAQPCYTEPSNLVYEHSPPIDKAEISYYLSVVDMWLVPYMDIVL